MAAGRPIVASATPAIKEIVSPNEALLYEPDNVEDLVHNVRQAVAGGAQVDVMVSQATHTAQNLSWSNRAKRVIQFIKSTPNESISR